MGRGQLCKKGVRLHIPFIGESGAPPPPTKRSNSYSVIGGLMAPEGVWEQLPASLAELERQFAVNGEIKWRFFAPHS